MAHPMPVNSYTCDLNLQIWTTVATVGRITAEAVVLILPVPYIWKLRFSVAQKTAIISIFAGGTL